MGAQIEMKNALHREKVFALLKFIKRLVLETGTEG
jgi:hypothetical protein